MTAMLVLAPDVGFDALADAAERLGWRRDPDPAAPEPVVDGEPELATWSRVARSGRLVSGYEPAVGVRSVEVRGDGAARWAGDLAAALPTLGVEDVARLLSAREAPDVLRGVVAARELADEALVAPLRALAGHPDETVRREARRALEALAPPALDAAPTTAELAAATALLRGLDAPARRQLVRLLGALTPAERKALLLVRGAGAGVVAVLLAALRDPDWEVRMSAVLAAGRVGARMLIPPIRAAELPAAGHAGVDHDDRMLLVAAREVVIAHLAGRDGELVGSHLGRCILGRPVDHPDDVVLFVAALTTPLSEDPPRAPRTRDGFVFVPPVEHWLGEDPRPGSLPNPPRRAAPAAGGFLVSALPQPAVAIEQARELGGELPTADEWEAAARGPDGRRHPWGLGIDRRRPAATSPWGAAGLVGRGEWARSGDALVVVGATVRCATRREPGPGERLAVRTVERLP